MSILNRTVLLSLMGAATLALTAGTSAHAQQGPGYWGNWHMGPGMMSGWGSGPRMQGYGRAAIIDLNDDGRISDAEAASAAEDVFLAMDADDNGEITKDEYMAVRMGPGTGWNSERQAQMQAQKEARYAELDTDGDGKVTKAEFLDTAKAHHAAADDDGDGTVSPWEHRRRNWF